MVIVCLYTGDTLTEETEIQLPENMIEGSARTFVSVLGKPDHF